MPLLPTRCPVRGQRHLLLCLAGSLVAWLEIPIVKASSEPGFESGFLREADGSGVHALSFLQSQQSLAPGRYLVTVRVNLEPAGRHELDFTADANGELQPCLPSTRLGEWGLRLDALASLEDASQACLDLTSVVPGAQVDFDSSRLRLSISIPQIAMRRDIAGNVDPSRWDSGINAAFLNYQASTLQGKSRYRGRYSNEDLYLNGGVNLGDWRLRSTQAWRQDSDGTREWTRAQTYAQRDLPGTRANITVGETFTDADIFGGVPVTGVRVASDMSMLPDALQGYAPVIRGVAQTRAKLEVWQNGYPIYATYVSPGPYAIDDLNTAGSGELEVVLTEADGQVRRFIQPYATLGNLQRQGIWRYSATVGTYNPASDLDKPLIWQATLSRGMEWDLTLYGGLMASEYYRAMNIGIGKDLGSLGAASFDVTQANSQLDIAEQASAQGQSYALKYGKAFATGTNLRFAGYRYSTEGYRDFSEAVQQRSHSTTFQGSRRSRLEASVHQRLGQRHSLSLTLSQQQYWQQASTQRQYQLGFNTYHAGISYYLFASQSLNDTYGSDRQFGLSLSMPLNFGRSANARYDLHKQRHGYTQRASLSGSTGDGRLSYNTSVAQDEDRQHSGALTLGYKTAHGNFGTGLTQGSDYQSLSLNASGALLLHAGGLELGSYLGDTAGLVEVPGVAGVGVQNSNGSRTNARGYALVPHLQPYRNNTVVLQTDKLGPDVEIENGTAQLVPRRGAIVKQQFSARQVSRWVLTLLHANGTPVPFGSVVLDAEDQPLGMVGQAGVTLLSAIDQPQTLSLSWGERDDQRCRLHVDPQHMQRAEGYHLQTLTCVADSFKEST
ncbi:fimbria/pilus outer membrane usher protein [Pseudomonas putida]|uniref:fimbria/pilus outer membrane usher protein n=1 Tax=Pseudomonas putida TaxID=303 RepID=UPI0018D77A2C|nr:fimbria/pilus outer membrane usher protein [Pseudomonas putida]MBH3411718.1 fimbrial biogenesis outer membrane usher protein [Pseudomonas putida]